MYKWTRKEDRRMKEGERDGDGEHGEMNAL